MKVATPAELREMAVHWDESAKICTVMAIKDVAHGLSGYGYEFAARDRRMAAALRFAADLIEREKVE